MATAATTASASRTSGSGSRGRGFGVGVDDGKRRSDRGSTRAGIDSGLREHSSGGYTVSPHRSDGICTGAPLERILNTTSSKQHQRYERPPPLVFSPTKETIRRVQMLPDFVSKSKRHVESDDDVDDEEEDDEDIDDEDDGVSISKQRDGTSEGNAKFEKQTTRENQPPRQDSDYWLDQMNLRDAELARVKQELAALRHRRKELEYLLNYEREHQHEVHTNTPLKQEYTTDDSSQGNLQAHIRRIYCENRQKAKQHIPQPVGEIDPSLIQKQPQPLDFEFVRRISQSGPAFCQKLAKTISAWRRADEEYAQDMAYKYLELQTNWMKTVRSHIYSSQEQTITNYRYFEETLPGAVLDVPSGITLEPQKDVSIEEDCRIFNPNDETYTLPLIDRVARDSPQLFGNHKRLLGRLVDTNGLVQDPVSVHETLLHTNAWTAQEENTFLQRYLQTPKDFVKIARYLPRKSVAECVLYYYRSKYRVGYKSRLEQLRKERNMKRRKKEKTKQRKGESSGNETPRSISDSAQQQNSVPLPDSPSLSNPIKSELDSSQQNQETKESKDNVATEEVITSKQEFNTSSEHLSLGETQPQLKHSFIDTPEPELSVSVKQEVQSSQNTMQCPDFNEDGSLPAKRARQEYQDIKVEPIDIAEKTETPVDAMQLEMAQTLASLSRACSNQNDSEQHNSTKGSTPAVQSKPHPLPSTEEPIPKSYSHAHSVVNHPTRSISGVSALMMALDADDDST